MRPRRPARWGFLPGVHEPPEYLAGWERGLGLGAVLGAVAVVGGFGLAWCAAWLLTAAGW